MKVIARIFCSTAVVTILGCTLIAQTKPRPFSFSAADYGSCTWDAGHDVGPCITAAISAAASAGGGEVIIPAGTYGLATPLIQNTSGVHLRGIGVGNPRDNESPGEFLAPTHLIWIGAAAATMLDVEPASVSVPSLYSADITGITFDCNSTAAICVKIAQVSHSRFVFGVSEPQQIGAYLTTTRDVDAPGTQDNDISIWSRSTSPAYAPTGILLDGGAGSNWNVSYNRIHHLYAWYHNGDGIVFGNSDNNIVDDLETFPDPGARGRATVFASTGYVTAGGQAVAGQAYATRVMHTGTSVQVAGFQSGSTLTAAPGNRGTGSAAPVTIPTNAPSAYLNQTLYFASTSGVARGMSVSCGIGTGSGVQPNSLVGNVAPGIVNIVNYIVGTVPSGTPCHFGYGVTTLAAPGTYTITAGGPTTFGITQAPPGGHLQTGVAVSGGVVSFEDVVVPISGTPDAGDSWTLTVPTPATDDHFLFVDKANSDPNPYFENGAVGTWMGSNDQYPHAANSSLSIQIFADRSYTWPGGMRAVGIGSPATGPFSAAIGGAGTIASGWFAQVVGGHNLTASGEASRAAGETSTADGQYSDVFGGQAIARGRTGIQVFAAGAIAQTGDAQATRSVMRDATHSTGWGYVTTNGNGTPGVGNCLNIPDDTAYQIRRATLIYRDTASGAIAAFHADNFILSRTRGAATTRLTPASVTMTEDQTVGTPGTVVSVLSADTSAGCLDWQIRPPNGDLAHWVGVIDVAEIQ